jgi:signal peptidase
VRDAAVARPAQDAIVRRFSWALTSLLLPALVVPVVAALLTVWARGWTVEGVLSGSMSPGIPKGAGVVLAPVDPATLRRGTVIAFDDPGAAGRVVTHRIVARDERPTGLFFTTQGDANGAPDPLPVPARAVRGEVRWRIVGLGRLIGALHRGATAKCLIAAPLAALVLSEAGGALGRRRHDALRREVTALRREIALLRASV